MPRKITKKKSNPTTEEAKKITREYVFQLLDERGTDSIVFPTYPELCNFLKIHTAAHSARTTQLKILSQKFYLLKTNKGYVIRRQDVIDLNESNDIITKIDEYSKFAVLCLLYSQEKESYEVTLSELAKHLGFITDEFNVIRNGINKYARKNNIPEAILYEFVDKVSKFYKARIDKILNSLSENGYIKYSKKLCGKRVPKNLIPKYDFDEFDDFTYHYEESGDEFLDNILTDDELSMIEELEKDAFFQTLSKNDDSIPDYKEKRDVFIAREIAKSKSKKECKDDADNEIIPMQILYKNNLSTAFYSRKKELVLSKMDYLFVYYKYIIDFNYNTLLSTALISAYAFGLISKENKFVSLELLEMAKRKINKMVIERLQSNKLKSKDRKIVKQLDELEMFTLDMTNSIKNIKKESLYFKRLVDVISIT